MTSTPRTALTAQSLLARSFTEKWNTTTGGPGGVVPTKLGLVHVDTPDQNTLCAAYANELAKHGLTFTDTVVWLLSRHGDVRLVAHGGNISKLQTSSFTLAPDHGLAVTVMTNCRQGAVVGAAALAWAVQPYLGRPSRDPLPTSR